jgi:hypothetical protein
VAGASSAGVKAGIASVVEKIFTTEDTEVHRGKCLL